MWSSGCGQLNMLCVERDFITSVSCNVAAKSVIALIGKRKNTTAKFNDQLTCFVQLVLLARPSLAIAREGLSGETIVIQ